MVSPIDHVVMNHQNHILTNSILGHVRYSYALAPDVVALSAQTGTLTTTPNNSKTRSTQQPARNVLAYDQHLDPDGNNLDSSL
jgi:hypothetical protein